MTRGKLVVLAGIDASGKATQAERLSKKLEAELFSFPNYKTETGQMILGHLTGAWDVLGAGPEHSAGSRKSALVRQTLFAINRHEVAGQIASHLANHRHVVCDRYYESGLVYGMADGLDEGWLWRIHERLPQPDCSILIDIPPEESIRRRPERRDDYEKRAGFMTKVREGYRGLFTQCAETGPGGWYIIDGMGTVEEVSERVDAYVRRHIKE